MDKKFREACRSHLNKIFLYQKLDDFVTSEACTQFININENEKPSLINYISENKDFLIHDLSNKTVNFLAGKPIYSSLKPDEYEDATIVSVFEPDQIQFELDEALYYGGGIIVVPCSFKTEVTIDAYIYKADYYAMDKTFHVSEHNDHYFSFEDTIEVSVDAKARFEFDIADLENVEILNCDMDSLDSIDKL